MSVRSFEVSMRERMVFVLLMTLSVTTPYTFHLAGLKGSVFLPMFLGVALASQYLKPVGVIGIALLAPTINHLFTGMPSIVPLPLLQILTLEGIVFGITALYLRRKAFNSLFKIGTPFIAGRISSVILVFLYADLSMEFWVTNLIQGVPGILLITALTLMVLKVFPAEE